MTDSILSHWPVIVYSIGLIFGVGVLYQKFNRLQKDFSTCQEKRGSDLDIAKGESGKVHDLLKDFRTFKEREREIGKELNTRIVALEHTCVTTNDFTDALDRHEDRISHAIEVQMQSYAKQLERIDACVQTLVALIKRGDGT